MKTKTYKTFITIDDYEKLGMKLKEGDTLYVVTGPGGLKFPFKLLTRFHNGKRVCWTMLRNKKKENMSEATLKRFAKIKMEFVPKSEYERIKGLAVYATQQLPLE